MWQEERHQRIRNLLATFGRISVDRITAEMEVSRETVRRDLLDMEANGELRRVRGGAIALDDESEAPFAERSQIRVKEKRMIAKLATTLVHSGQSLFLDAGSTTTILAEELSALDGLTIITNSLEAAQKLQDSAGKQRTNRVVLIGGDMATNPASTCGELAINEISRYQLDFAMLSPYSFNLEQGAASYEPREAEVARAMSRYAERTVILADHTKIGVKGKIGYCPATKIDTLIVDSQAQTLPSWGSVESALNNVLVARKR